MASGLELISSMRLDRREDIQIIKSAWSNPHSKLKTNVLRSLEGNCRGRKTNTHLRYSITISFNQREPV